MVPEFADVTLAGDREDVALFWFEGHLPSFRPRLEFGDVVLQLMVVVNAVDFPVDDAVVSKESHSWVDVAGDVIDIN